MKAAAIREMTGEELVVKLEELKREHLNLRFQHSTQQLESPARIRQVRRDIARINTILAERKKA